MHEVTRYIPDEMKARKQWALWRLETRGGHTTKIPYSVNYSGRASSTDPRTWGSYEQAVNQLVKSKGFYNGISFALTGDGLVFIDIDHSIGSDRKLNDTARDILSTLGKTYIEISQSGHGLHLFVHGTIPKSFNNRATGVEMYSDGRFCAMTGNALCPVEPVSNQEGLDLVFNKYKTRDYTESGHVQRESLFDLSDRDIVDKARDRSCVFSDLYSGNLARYNSASEADFVLCLILAFWCDRDPVKIDRIFRTSGLYREKWNNRPDYRERTISRACSACGESLSDYIREQRQEARKVYEAYYA